MSDILADTTTILGRKWENTVEHIAVLYFFISYIECRLVVTEVVQNNTQECSTVFLNFILVAMNTLEFFMDSTVLVIVIL